MKNGATFRIIDLETRKQWDVEVIQDRKEHRTDFGESLRGQICDGAIKESESKISSRTHKDVRIVRNPLEL